MAAVLGGTQSLHTNSMDETLALPSEKAAEIALRTQQVLAYETGVVNVVDPLGGSWYIEQLTNKMEEAANNYFSKIDNFGGVIPCIENGYLQTEISDSSSKYNKLIESKERVVVGMNKFNKLNEKIDIPLLKISREVEDNQIRSLEKIKSLRNDAKVTSKLNVIENTCKTSQNLVPVIVDAVLEYATLGEIVIAMKNYFGDWTENSII
jgi:methylmalonyl-CoA mutase N-terminal domain/subunit